MSNSPAEITSATSQAEKERYILAQLLGLRALCKEHNIYLPDIYRKAEDVADPKRG